MDKWSERTLALAGVFQATAQVDKLASTGQLDKGDFKTSVKSLLEQSPSSVLATYGELANLETGLNALIQTLGSGSTQRSTQCLRYTLGIFHIQSKLTAQSDTLEIIGSRLKQVNQQAEHFEPTHDNVVGNLADLYVDTISKFRFRIHVRGDATYLQQQRVAAQIRTLLFSAVRSAILWRQIGGRRWQVIFYRKRILAHAAALLAEAKKSRIKLYSCN